jgi:DnaJ-domain-containing protein 1
MRLDHDSGVMTGAVTAGTFAGRELDALSQPELQALLAELQAADPDGVRLLDAYLDRRFAGRGENADPNADTRGGGAAKGGAMTKQEAYDILGLQPGAGEEAVRQAHRNLIKRLHPDAGGSSALAARVNEAKDVLLK